MGVKFPGRNNGFINRILCLFHQLAQKLLRFFLQNLTNILQHGGGQLIIHLRLGRERDEADAGIVGLAMETARATS
jgi:hypothetical protein